jgi:hypothetical protein
MLAAEKSKDTFIAPIGIGLSLFVVEIAGVNFSGASVNPARSFGPCVASADFPGYFWIYCLGPALGAVLAAGFYHFVKVREQRLGMVVVLIGYGEGILLTFLRHSSSTTKTLTLDKIVRARMRSSMLSLRRATWRMVSAGTNKEPFEFEAGLDDLRCSLGSIHACVINL